MSFSNIAILLGQVCLPVLATRSAAESPKAMVWPIPHQRSGRHHRARAIWNSFGGINEEARKGMGPIQDSETAGSVRPSGGTNSGRSAQSPRLCPLRAAVSQAAAPFTQMAPTPFQRETSNRHFLVSRDCTPLVVPFI